MSCPSRFELAAATARSAETARSADSDPRGDETGALAAHLAWCARCRGAIDELGASRRELFGDDEDAAVRAAAVRAAGRSLAAAVNARRAGRARRFVLALMPVALAAAGFALWVKPARDVRAKGDFVLDLYCKRGEAVFPGQDGADFLPGDRLRFAYTTSETGYLVVFGVDDRGGVFPYYPERSLAGVKLPPGEKVLLPGSIELDAHHGWERTFALWSRAPFDDGALRAHVNEGLRAVGGDLRRAARLPIGAAQISYLLRRP